MCDRVSHLLLTFKRIRRRTSWWLLVWLLSCGANSRSPKTYGHSKASGWNIILSYAQQITWALWETIHPGTKWRVGVNAHEIKWLLTILGLKEFGPEKGQRIVYSQIKWDLFIIIAFCKCTWEQQQTLRNVCCFSSVWQSKSVVNECFLFFLSGFLSSQIRALLVTIVWQLF